MSDELFTPWDLKAMPSLEGLFAAEDARRESVRQAEEAALSDASSAEQREAELELCRNDIVHWVNNWVWTFDPRLLGTLTADGRRASPFLPMKLWPRQVEALLFIDKMVKEQAEWVAEKSRDVGFSYLIMCKALHGWLFEPGFKGTFGSYVEDKVDKKDDPDSLFEKARIILRRLPAWMLPASFSFRNHDFFKRLINPETGAILTGEAGENMGRGGRSTMYVVDEAAFVEHAEGVEAALAGTTDCVGWVSTSNGTGCLFYRKLQAVPAEHKFRLHWRDDPRKDDAWARKKQDSLTEPTAWASEFEIDHSASMEGIVLPGKWVLAAEWLGNLACPPRGTDGRVGMDVGGGKAKSVVVGRFGPVVLPPRSKGDPDTIDTANWGLDFARELGARMVNYDVVGIGAGVASAMKRASTAGFLVQGVNVGVEPTGTIWPDGRTSDDMFGNLKAEIWWLARDALKRSYELMLFLQDQEGGVKHPIGDCVVFQPGASADEKRELATLITQLSLVKWFRNERGKIVIETKDQLRRRGVKSPDYAEAYVLTYAEKQRINAQGWLDYAAAKVAENRARREGTLNG